jgi:hypothetical protein
MIRTSGCTIEAFAEATGLTTQFLADVGVKQGTADKRPCVRLSDKVTYLTPPSDDAAGEGSIERKGRQLALFGLDSLELIDETDSVYLIADEIEALTLRFHDLAALAVPKVASWPDDWPALERAAHVYVVLSDGDQPVEPPAWIAEAPFRDRVRLVRLLKGFGIQQLHRHRPRFFLDAWKTTCSSATSWAEVENERRAQLRAVAAARCADLIGAPDVLASFATDLQRAGFAGDTTEAKLLYLIGTSRLLPKPISVAVKGPSSAGKSFLVKKVLEFFPSSAFLTMTAMSPKALVYSKEPLAHRVLVLYEADGMGPVAELILRSLLSEGHIVYDTVASEDGSAPDGKRIEREGPTSFITTTTRISLHRENETRFFSLTVSDSPEHTRAILRAVAAEDVATVEYARWHALQEFLAVGEHEVTIPFGLALADLVTTHAVRLRRDFGALLSLIRTHALLHQESRERDSRGRIVATFEDYASVHGLVHRTFAEASEQTVPAEVRETVEAVQHFDESVRPEEGGKGITLKNIANRFEVTGTRLDRTTILRRVNHAISLGFLADEAGGGKGKPKQIVLAEPLGHRDAAVLPTPAELEEVCADARTSA